MVRKQVIRSKKSPIKRAKKKRAKKPISTGGVCSHIKDLLITRKEKVVFVESCTAGLASATLAQTPGISEVHCGSMATYRPSSKKLWAGVPKRVIKKYTTESQECVNAMAIGALEKTPEATWSCAIVGHLGPNAPNEKDGQLFIAIARRSRKGNVRIRHEEEKTSKRGGRVLRMNNASDFLLRTFNNILLLQDVKEQDHEFIRELAEMAE